MNAPPRVIKLGGSLLDFEGLVPQFRLWRSVQSPAVDVLVVGGGPLVDAIRQLDRAQHLSDEAAHWLSIKALGITAKLVAAMLGEANLISEIDQLQRASVAAQLYILDVWNFLKNEPLRTADPLPASWLVTSDSIAARVARQLGASELVLLKSALPARQSTLADLTAGGYLDRYFEQAIGRGVRVRCVNLRASGFPTIELMHHDENTGRHASQSAIKS